MVRCAGSTNAAMMSPDDSTNNTAGNYDTSLSNKKQDIESPPKHATAITSVDLTNTVDQDRKVTHAPGRRPHF